MSFRQYVVQGVEGPVYVDEEEAAPPPAYPSAAASQSLSVSQSAAATVSISAQASQSLSVDQSAGRLPDSPRQFVVHGVEGPVYIDEETTRQYVVNGLYVDEE